MNMVEQATKNIILLVDDSRAILKLLTAYIEQNDFLQVVTAESYAGAKACLNQQGDSPFLCAVLDLHLPDAPNGEIIALVQQFNIPIIILTASRDIAIKQTLEAELIIEYVIKSEAEEIEYVAGIVSHIYYNQFCKVLLVDDSLAYLQYLSSLVENLRYQVLLAKDGLEALEVLDKNTDISVIITDYVMPRMDGLELINAVRSRYKKEEISILGISMSDNRELIVRLLKMGANDFMPKPIIPDEFYCRVIQNVNMIQYVREIKKTATSDYLTQLHNRRNLFELGEVLYANAKRGALRIVAAMIDADHFKQVNDRYGHDVGDIVLVSIANALKRSMRVSDIIARFGGEEFVCIAVIKEDKDAMILFEKVRKAVAALSIPVGKEELKVTISIGASYNLGNNLDEMLKFADDAMYQAKENGRNQVVIA